MNLTVIVPAQEVQVEVPEVFGVNMVPSFAGTEEKYFATPDGDFRARNLNGDGIRIHISRDVIRERQDYIALDLDASDVLRVIALAQDA